MSLISTVGFSQDDKDLVALGLPGDNLNLYAVLDIFQKSPNSTNQLYTNLSSIVPQTIPPTEQHQQSNCKPN